MVQQESQCHEKCFNNLYSSLMYCQRRLLEESFSNWTTSQCLLIKPNNQRKNINVLIFLLNSHFPHSSFFGLSSFSLSSFVLIVSSFTPRILCPLLVPLHLCLFVIFWSIVCSYSKFASFSTNSPALFCLWAYFFRSLCFGTCLSSSSTLKDSIIWLGRNVSLFCRIDSKMS